MTQENSTYLYLGAVLKPASNPLLSNNVCPCTIAASAIDYFIDGRGKNLKDETKKPGKQHYCVDAQLVQMRGRAFSGRFMEQATPMFQGPTGVGQVGTFTNINPFAFTPFSAVNPFQFAPGVVGPFGLPVGRLQPTPISPQEFQRRQARGIPPGFSELRGFMRGASMLGLFGQQPF